MKQVKTIRAKDMSLVITILREYFPDIKEDVLLNSIKNSDKDNTGRLLTYDDVAERWNCSKRHVVYQCEKGALATVKIGLRAIRIPEAELLRYSARIDR